MRRLRVRLSSRLPYFFTTIRGYVVEGIKGDARAESIFSGYISPSQFVSVGLLVVLALDKKGWKGQLLALAVAEWHHLACWSSVSGVLKYNSKFLFLPFHFRGLMKQIVRSQASSFLSRDG